MQAKPPITCDTCTALFGAEVLWGRRTDNDGASDDDTRLQFTVKFTFGTRLTP